MPKDKIMLLCYRLLSLILSEKYKFCNGIVYFIIFLSSCCVLAYGKLILLLTAKRLEQADMQIGPIEHARIIRCASTCRPLTAISPITPPVPGLLCLTPKYLSALHRIPSSANTPLANQCLHTLHLSPSAHLKAT